MAKVFLYFKVMKHHQGLQENQWWQKSPPEEESGNGKLVNFLYPFLTYWKEFRRMKTYMFLKIILLYFIVIMTDDTVGRESGAPIILRQSGGPQHVPI